MKRTSSAESSGPTKAPPRPPAVPSSVPPTVPPALPHSVPPSLPPTLPKTARAVGPDSPLTLRSHEFFLMGDALGKKDDKDLVADIDAAFGRRPLFAWIATAVAILVALVAVIMFAVERTGAANEIGKREVRIAELEATSGTQQEKIAALEAERAKGAADAEKADAEAKARSKVVVDAITAAAKDEIARGDVVITTAGDTVTIELADRLLFPDDPLTLGEPGVEVLGRLGAVLAGLGDRRLEVVGHSDNRKPRGWDKVSFWEIGAARASRVVVALEESAKVPSKQLVLSSRGAADPKASNGNNKNRQKNRRTELVLTRL